MRVEISNPRVPGRLRKARARRLLLYLMGRVQRLAGGRDWKDVSLVVTDDPGIRAIHRAHLGRPETTDVLSFLYEPMPGDQGLFGAEIVVNLQRAEREGPRIGPRTWTSSKELALYIAHGCDHLSGETDADRSGRRRMRRRELRWLRDADKLGLLADLIA